MMLGVKEVSEWARAEGCVDGGDTEVSATQSSRTHTGNYHI